MSKKGIKMNLAAMMWYDDEPFVYIDGARVQNTDLQRVLSGLARFRQRFRTSDVSVIRVSSRADLPLEVEGVPIEFSENVRPNNFLFVISERQEDPKAVLVAENSEDIYSDEEPTAADIARSLLRNDQPFTPRRKKRNGKK